ncbi:hypothetical protein GCK72_013217 [Caenorhabditis remanei]|uniref:DNA helicase n=1 Tax=Caenorhabditis remanei TaxID=31234 RepID=A0A6A5GQ88_CAERE|nr:hypothetical protein GCK72_013217 [Caenorhabditis remanei]KAF1756763.1 hypothetical protein GCK72_013217 [Caenorhabditis remanei]
MSAQMQLGQGGSAKPFGGISMVVFGNLLQLEPVTHGAVYEALPLEFKALRDASYPCITENLWGLFKMMRLHRNVRVEEQEDAKHLNALREDPGRNRKRIARMPDSIRMRWLKVEKNDAEKVEEWIEASRWVRPLTLAPGCKVTLVTTIDKRRKLVNGAIGKIKKIYPDSLVVDFPGVKNQILHRTSFRIRNKSNEYFWWRQFPVREAQDITRGAGKMESGSVREGRGDTDEETKR